MPHHLEVAAPCVANGVSHCCSDAPSCHGGELTRDADDHLQQQQQQPACNVSCSCRCISLSGYCSSHVLGSTSNTSAWQHYCTCVGAVASITKSDELLCIQAAHTHKLLVRSNNATSASSIIAYKVAQPHD
jgi:hypothetical protein